MQKMTAQQKELAEKNMRLVYGILHRKFPELAKPGKIDDWAQMGFLGLCKAAVAYDESRGTTFSTFAGIAIQNEILQGLRSLNRPSRKAEQYALRLDAPADGEESDSWEALTPDSSQDVEAAVECRDVLRQLKGLAKPELIAAACGRMTQVEAGKALGISQPQVCRKIAKIRMIMKEHAYDQN